MKITKDLYDVILNSVYILSREKDIHLGLIESNQQALFDNMDFILVKQQNNYYITTKADDVNLTNQGITDFLIDFHEWIKRGDIIHIKEPKTHILSLPHHGQKFDLPIQYKPIGSEMYQVFDGAQFYIKHFLDLPEQLREYIADNEFEVLLSE